MKEKTDTKETARERAMTDIAEKALKNYEQVVRTGLRLQEEAGRCITSMFTQTASVQDLHKPMTYFNSVANGVLPEAQKRMQEMLDLVESNTRTGVELMKKAVDAAQTPVIAESQSKWMDFWATSLGAARTNTEALLQINSRALDSWVDFVQKNTEITQVRVPKGA
jgi:hypothetical protein